jgi:hypothetical protein
MLLWSWTRRPPSLRGFDPAADKNTNVRFAAAETLVRLAVQAVFGELVSGRNSLLIGKRTGNSSQNPAERGKATDLRQRTQWVSVQFPEKGNRERNLPEQGILRRITANRKPVASRRPPRAYAAGLSNRRQMY